jgi:hypothetical protein
VYLRLYAVYRALRPCIWYSHQRPCIDIPRSDLTGFELNPVIGNWPLKTLNLLLTSVSLKKLYVMAFKNFVDSVKRKGSLVEALQFTLYPSSP